MIALLDKILTWAGEHFQDLTRGALAYSLVGTAIYMEIATEKGAPEWLISVVSASVVMFYFERVANGVKARARKVT